MLQIKKMRLPTSTEYDLLTGIAKDDNAIMHWKNIYSWCQDVRPGFPSSRVTRGSRSARYWSSCIAANRYEDVGFRPVFEILGSDPLLPDGAIVTVGTLYMNGQPVQIPQNPVWNGDIPNYIPGATLEFREPVGDPKYQVKAIKAGSVLVADRTLLKNISWDDLNKLGFCSNANNQNLEGGTKMKKNQSIIYFGDMMRNSFAIACSQENEKRVSSFLARWYPEWVKDYEGRYLSIWNKILDTADIIKELLGDENLELLGRGNKALIRLEDEVYSDSFVVCSRENEERVKAFLTKRYPKWVSKCIGKTGMTPWNDVLDAVRDMRELLGDDNLEFLGGCKDVRIPSLP